MTISDGGVANIETINYAAIGELANSTGVVTVTGSGSAFYELGVLEVGDSGTGTLVISNSGLVSTNGGGLGGAPGSSGMVTITGSGSTWSSDGQLDVGDSGAGTLAISNGGTLSGSDDILIAHQATATGRVTISGSGSTMTTTAYLDVGASGSGTLLIFNGGSVGDQSGLVGLSPVSSGAVTVNGAGSAWTSPDDIFVGVSGTGTLLVAGGGGVTSGGPSSNVVSNTRAVHGKQGVSGSIIGEDAGSTGVVTVTGTGSTWTASSDLAVADGGTGTLGISNGGGVSDDNGWIAYGGTSSGMVSVTGSGSAWASSGRLSIGESGTGTLVISRWSHRIERQWRSYRRPGRVPRRRRGLRQRLGMD